MSKLSISAIVLTSNEEIHIRRCLESVFRIATNVFVIDCFSKDKTVEIAKACGATIKQHEYINQAQQFQWALDNCKIETEWVMRLDADEYLSDDLIQEISEKLPLLPTGINGVNLKLCLKFLGKEIRYGHLKPVTVLRLWRNDSAFMEQRWMDERIVLKEGETVTFKHYFIDDNLNGLAAWTQKHNIYSNREVVTELDKQYHFWDKGEDASLAVRNSRKGLYYRLPKFFRALAYFTVRYVFFLGFLDGVRGLVWLTLQAYWYRFLVDSKIYEMEKRLGKTPPREAVIEYVRRFYNIDIPA